MNATCTVQYVDHVGIAVHNLEAASDFFHEVFQVPPGEIVELPEQGVRADPVARGPDSAGAASASISR